MRTIWILTIIALGALGCNGKEPGPADTAANGEDAHTTHTENRTPEGATDDAPGRGALDPVFKDYEYPGSKFESMFPMADTVSAVYTSSDDLADVVDFYKKKFPDTNVPTSGSTVGFGKSDPDGNDFTVTVTRTNANTQIILKSSKKR